MKFVDERHRHRYEVCGVCSQHTSMHLLTFQKMPLPLVFSWVVQLGAGYWHAHTFLSFAYLASFLDLCILLCPLFF